ncbi:MAG: transcription antitermination factor NusB [Eubacterium sp.]|nr:transcription antitermination factor NusB [Eubacterium sp.]
MTRHELREQIFKTVFQIPFYDGYVPALDLEDISGKESEDVDDILPEEIQKDIDYIDNKVTAIQDRVSEIDNEIDTHSNSWKVARMGKTELAILRVAVYEILFDDDIPNAVAVNEAIELAKVYSDEKSAAFINGVLDGIIKKES